MEQQTLFNGYKVTEQFKEARKALLEKPKPSKADRALAYMMGGRPLTGKAIYFKFHALSYRDVIYDIRRRGYEVESKELVDASGESNYNIWWLKDFSWEFIKDRIEIM